MAATAAFFGRRHARTLSCFGSAVSTRRAGCWRAAASASLLASHRPLRRRCSSAATAALFGRRHARSHASAQRSPRDARTTGVWRRQPRCWRRNASRLASTICRTSFAGALSASPCPAHNSVLCFRWPHARTLELRGRARSIHSWAASNSRQSPPAGQVPTTGAWLCATSACPQHLVVPTRTTVHTFELRGQAKWIWVAPSRRPRPVLGRLALPATRAKRSHDHSWAAANSHQQPPAGQVPITGAWLCTTLSAHNIRRVVPARTARQSFDCGDGQSGSG